MVGVYIKRSILHTWRPPSTIMTTATISHHVALIHILFMIFNNILKKKLAKLSVRTAFFSDLHQFCLWKQTFPLDVCCWILFSLFWAFFYHFVLLSCYFTFMGNWTILLFADIFSILHRSYFFILLLHQSWNCGWFKVKLCVFNLYLYSLGCLSNFPASSEAWSVIFPGFCGMKSFHLTHININICFVSREIFCWRWQQRDSEITFLLCFWMYVWLCPGKIAYLYLLSVMHVKWWMRTCAACLSVSEVVRLFFHQFLCSSVNVVHRPLSFSDNLF